MHGERWLALRGWHAPALSPRARDCWMGWSSLQQRHRCSWYATSPAPGSYPKPAVFGKRDSREDPRECLHVGEQQPLEFAKLNTRQHCSLVESAYTPTDGLYKVVRPPAALVSETTDVTASKLLLTCRI